MNVGVARFALPIGLMVAITLASSQPGTDLPSIQFRFADKLVHAGAFALLGAAWLWALGHKRWAPLAAVIICTAFGALDELHQSTVPGRFPDVFDAVADTVGAVLGVAFLSAWRARRRNSRRKKETHGDDPHVSRQEP